MTPPSRGGAPDSSTSSRGWIHGVATFNPITFILEAGRGFIQGDPTQVLKAFGVSAGLVLVFAVWARLGLRRAEQVGA